MPVDTMQDLLDWHPPNQKELISGGILLPGTRLLYVGGPKTWKSMMAMYTGWCLATGHKWFGFRTTKCVVFKYQVELPKAIDRKRVAKFNAAIKAAGLKHTPDNYYFKTDVFTKLDTALGINKMRADIEWILKRHDGSHLVLMLDPVYQMLTGEIEKSYDVTRFTDNINLLLHEYPMSVILVHHTRKARADSEGKIMDLGADEATGSRYLTNWCDTSAGMRVTNPTKGANHVTLRFSLTRNAENILPTLDIRWPRETLIPELRGKELPEEGDELPNIRSIGQ